MLHAAHKSKVSGSIELFESVPAFAKTYCSVVVLVLLHAAPVVHDGFEV